MHAAGAASDHDFNHGRRGTLLPTHAEMNNGQIILLLFNGQRYPDERKYFESPDPLYASTKHFVLPTQSVLL